jgi:hypothetical protein
MMDIYLGRKDTTYEEEPTGNIRYIFGNITTAHSVVMFKVNPPKSEAPVQSLLPPPDKLPCQLGSHATSEPQVFIYATCKV